VNVRKTSTPTKSFKDSIKRRKPKKGELTLAQFEQNLEMAAGRIFVEHLIRVVKIFRIASERFRLNSWKYEQIIMTICGIVRLRIGALVLP